ncbi:hypothetical protein V6C27_01460 [Peptococcaceae bacterium 1198_IL3148]
MLKNGNPNMLIIIIDLFFDFIGRSLSMGAKENNRIYAYIFLKCFNIVDHNSYLVRQSLTTGGPLQKGL